MLKTARSFFTAEQKEAIRQAIMAAEKDTSGEIMVHIETFCLGNVLKRATKVFHRLKMHHTAQRNGVLIYLAVRHRKFAIIGDSGINEKVGSTFWNDVKDNMLKNFKQDEFTKGLTEAISETGKNLKVFFPYQSDDVNELPDDVSFGSF